MHSVFPGIRSRRQARDGSLTTLPFKSGSYRHSHTCGAGRMEAFIHCIREARLDLPKHKSMLQLLGTFLVIYTIAFVRASVPPAPGLLRSTAHSKLWSSIIHKRQLREDLAATPHHDRVSSRQSKHHDQRQDSLSSHVDH